MNALAIKPLLTFITGGNAEDPLTDYSNLIFAETKWQVKKYFSSRASVLIPKHVPKVDINFSLGKIYDIVCVGTFNKNKNQQFLLPLAKHFKLLFIGDGPLYEETMFMAEGFSENIIFVGELSREDTIRQIARAKLLAHPAYKEGFPRVFSEAMAVGVPIIACCDAIQVDSFDEGMGILVKREEFRAEIFKLLSNSAYYEKIFSKSTGSEYDCEVAIELSIDNALKILETARPLYSGSVINRLFVIYKIIILRVKRLINIFKRRCSELV